MAPRIRIGKLFGTVGLFISKPGKDVTIAGSELTFDPRFEFLEIHERGSFTPSYFAAPVPGTPDIWYGSTTFTDLGYKPLFIALPRRTSDQNDNLPYGLITYPYPVTFNTEYWNGMDAFTIEIQGTNTLYFGGQSSWGLNHNSEMRVDYIIFKNPAT